ncbi:DUF5011 domain-containing protein, partial [Bacillus sp. MHSD17]|nr:DUF5011 domain-containing protein [Bacillus sp. MHSD17]
VTYLIAQGGTHNGVTVNGIGEDKMFDIFYYANTDELNMTSNFTELRLACLKVATNKYGANSIEVEAVQKAFDAARIKGTVKENEKTESNQVPELTVPPTITLRIGDKFDPMSNIKGIDKEDDNLTSKVKVEGEVDTFKVGTYILKYTVTDSKGHEGTEKQTVTVKVREEVENEIPILKVPATTTITEGDHFNLMVGVSAIDKEDGNITTKVAYEGTVDTSIAEVGS